MEWILSGLIAIAVGWSEYDMSKNHQTYAECRAENPKVHNTVTSWQHDPCSTWLYTKWKWNKI